MPSVLAIVSKAVFEKMVPKTVAPGEVVDTDRYASRHAAFDKLSGGAIFLVTVRPPNESLWLVGILESPQRDGDAWVSAPNKTPIRDVTSLIPELKFATGTGITAKKGALGMSLQTPRVLTDADVALLRPESTASDAYRQAVDQVPAAARARAEAAAAGDETLRFENYRRPFAMLATLPPAQKEQLQEIATRSEAGPIEELAHDGDWSPMELVDVVDVATGNVTHQFYLWPYGSAELFEHDTTYSVAHVVQHDYQAEPGDLPFRKALASAYARAEPQLGELVDFRLNWEPVAPPQSEVDFKQATWKLVASLADFKGGVPAFETLTDAQKGLVRYLIEHAPPGFRGFPAFELVVPKALRRWAGMDPPGVLEKRVGDRAAWSWLNDAAYGVTPAEEAIAALVKALTAEEISDVCTLSATTDDYTLFESCGTYTRGTLPATEYSGRLFRLLGAVIDASGDDAALAFARRAESLLGENDRTLLRWVASFALAARARRRGEAIPDEHFALVPAFGNFSWGLHLDCCSAVREVVERMTPAQRQKFAAENPHHYSCTTLDDRKDGRKLTVPVLMGNWWYADLLPHEEAAEAVVEAIARDGSYKKLKAELLEVIKTLGPACVAPLERAIAAEPRSSQHALLVAARKTLLAHKP